MQLKSDPPGPPSYRTLALLAAAAGLPFVGFGFVDNCIMVSIYFCVADSFFNVYVMPHGAAASLTVVCS